jgi:hypothetical protein
MEQKEKRMNIVGNQNINLADLGCHLLSMGLTNPNFEICK